LYHTGKTNTEGRMNYGTSWDIWDLSDSLSSRVALSFQWIPGHTGLSGNEWADALAKIRATLP